MSATPHRVVAALLLVIQVLVSIVLSGHTHNLVVRLVSDPVLASHECGANERHIPLSELHSCPLCQQMQVRQSLPVATEWYVVFARSEDCVVIRTVTHETVRTYLLPTKRGPPALS